jgi:hypothetical protein
VGYDSKPNAESLCGRISMIKVHALRWKFSATVHTGSILDAREPLAASGIAFLPIVARSEITDVAVFVFGLELVFHQMDDRSDVVKHQADQSLFFFSC